MPNDSNPEIPFDDPDFHDLVTGKVEELRKRLIDGSRRNPLINVPFRANSRSNMRVIDELPDVLRYRLSNKQEMRLVPLPALEEPLPDENTDAFLEALTTARHTDEIYASDIAAIDTDQSNVADMEELAERALKDRIRDELGLPPRQTKDKPSLATHARTHDIRPDYELPRPEESHTDGRHDDYDIQTLLLPDRLSRTAKALYERARSYERETGVNVLQTIFGLLEWKPPGETTPFLSPLVQIETRIIRRQSPSGAEFYLAGETEPTVNTSLALKLEVEHGLSLPKYECDDVEIYFETVASNAPQGWAWRVRRELVVGIFPSSKIAMYHDLDTSKIDVAKSPLVAKLLGTTAGGIGGYAEDYEPDDPDIAHKVPYLVLDADASQFSAMVDVANNHSLAIEGPPGSGKSQTIVNIVASALVTGKKVLFVAEKLTALDVVKARLEAIGLGEFILPLQAGRSTSERVYESLDARLEATSTLPGSERLFEGRRRHLEAERNKLQTYLDALSAPFEDSGMTVHEVLGRAIATASARQDLQRHLRRNMQLQPMTADEIKTALSSVDLLEDRIERLANVSRVWREARTLVMSADDAEDHAESARDVLDLIGVFENALSNTPLSRCINSETRLGNIAERLSQLPVEASKRISAAKLALLFDAERRRRLEKFIQLAEEKSSLVGTLGRHLRSPKSEGIERRLRKAVSFAHTDGNGHISPNIHEAAAKKAETVREFADSLEKELVLLPRAYREGAESLLAIQNSLRTLLMHTEEARTAAVRLPSDCRTLADSLQNQAKGLEEQLEATRRDLPGLGVDWMSATKFDSLVRAAAALADTGFFWRMGSEYKAARKIYENDLRGTKDRTRDQRAENLRKAASVLEEIKSFNENRRGIETFGALFEGLETNFESLNLAVVAAEDMHRHSDGTSDTIKGLATLKSQQFPLLLSDTQNPILASLLNKVPNAIAAVRQVAEDRANLERRRAADAAAHMELFATIGNENKGLDADYVENLADDCKRVSDLDELVAKVEIGDLVPIDDFTDVDPTILARESLHLAETLTLFSDERVAFDVFTEHGLDAVRKDLETLTQGEVELLKRANAFAEALDSPTPEDVWAICARASDYKLAAETSADLLECGRLARAEQELYKIGLQEFTKWYREIGANRPSRPARELAEACIAKAMADAAVSEHRSALEGYSGEDLDRIRKTIAQRDRELVQLSRDLVRHTLLHGATPPAGISIGRKSSYTDMALINNERAKKKRRVGVRELTRRASRALIELKPCWMMSPLAVAQYLHEGVEFDLLVVDEASQMTPENAIGPMRRVKQAVVVGDTKQLPPTTFFSKVMQDEETDEDLREESESLLDLANAAFTPIRQLRWHYRSLHSGLIRFSNHWMYDDNLAIFPAANENDPKLGVSLKRVQGIYQSRTNRAEAEAVVKAIVDQMTNEPQLSLGVCTMNVDQKDLILEEFERERDRNTVVQEYIAHWEEASDGLEEFFVKNLETIQGDERDVMFISTLYGPEVPGGPVLQRFGPINSVHGHRRLNVLFTRAKSKNVTFTSMSPSDIKVDDNKAKGVRMFRAWLEYAGSGQLPENTSAGGMTESPFEDHVIKTIESLGYEAVPQVGVAGFRIDIGVRHPDWPYGYVLGVECDGATYHSSRSARDRDRLREEVLQNRGWILHRIWSTDWFSNPGKERIRLQQIIEEVVAKLKQQREEGIGSTSEPQESTSSLAQNGETEKSDHSTKSSLQSELRSENTASEATLPNPPLQGSVEPTQQDRTVQIGNRIRLRKLDNSLEEMLITLSNDRNAPEHGLIGNRTPLGEAILDAEVGDEIEYQAGPYIRKVEIISIEEGDSS